jgi:hypothetical protein
MYQWLALNQASLSLNGTYPINRTLMKLRKWLELRCGVLLCYPDFNKPLSFIFILIHQIISWGHSSCRIKILKPVIYESKTKIKRGIQPFRERERLVISYWNLQGIQEYQVRLPLAHYSLYDHKNNTFNGLNALDLVLRTFCNLLLEEYRVTFEYIPGKKNVVVDVLFCLDIDSLKIQE